MTDRPKIPVVRRRPAADGAKEGPDPSGTTTIPTPARGLDRAVLERYVNAPERPPAERDRAPRRNFYTPNAIVAPREPNPTPSRPILREAPVVAPNVRTFGSSRAKTGGSSRPFDRSKRLPRPIREIKPPTPPKPRPPIEVSPLDDLSIKVLHAVADLTARNAALPQASDPAFVPGAAYRDLKRVLDLAWPDVRDAVQRARPHQVLRVARFFGRFGPVFVLSDYGKAVLAAVDAGQPIPDPPEDIRASLEAAKAARALWDADQE